MNPAKEAVQFIRKNLSAYGIEWINKDRTSDDFKFLIFGPPGNGKQIGIYDRSSIIVRLEGYDGNIDGVERMAGCAKTHAANVSGSNFRNGKGVCVKVRDTEALRKLLDWYYGTKDRKRNDEEELLQGCRKLSDDDKRTILRLISALRHFTPC
jgi:hypothetical protein